MAKQLKLILNINEKSRAPAASEELATLADALCKCALGVELPSQLRNAILSNFDASDTIKGKLVSLEYERFAGTVDGFTAYFTIGYYQPSYEISDDKTRS